MSLKKVANGDRNFHYQEFLVQFWDFCYNLEIYLSLEFSQEFH